MMKILWKDLKCLLGAHDWEYQGRTLEPLNGGSSKKSYHCRWCGSYHFK